MKSKMLFRNKTLITILIILFSYQSNSQSVEYMVKASFIEKFARFTDWGTNMEGEFFVITILGESPFSGELEKMAKKIKIKNKTIKINYIDDYRDIKDCQVLFICSSEANKLPKIIKFIEHMNILTVSDTPGFCKKGIQTNFYIDKSDTIKFEINPTALNKAKLTIDMQLLSLGKIIN